MYNPVNPSFTIQKWGLSVCVCVCVGGGGGGGVKII